MKQPLKAQQPVIVVRSAKLDDIWRLFHWRNDPETRFFSKNKERVSWNDHVKWCRERMKHKGFYICEREGVPIGTVRVDDGTLSYTVDPGRRHEGLCTLMLKEIYHLHGQLIAECYENNAGSIKAAEKAGHLVKLLAR